MALVRHLSQVLVQEVALEPELLLNCRHLVSMQCMQRAALRRQFCP